MSIDTGRIRQFSIRCFAAADLLQSCSFPSVPSWKGNVANIYRQRAEEFQQRQQELSSYARRAAGIANIFAEKADELQQEIARSLQRYRALEDELHGAMRAWNPENTEPESVRSIRRERNYAYENFVSLKQELRDVERHATAELQSVFTQSHVTPLVKILVDSVPLGVFMQYRNLVFEGVLPEEGINWSTDYCSDNGWVTGSGAKDACVLHDVTYRNYSQLGEKDAVKAKADTQLSANMLRNWKGSPGPVAWAISPIPVASQMIASGGVWLGVHFFGHPNESEPSGDTPAKYQQKKRQKAAKKKKKK
jgi:hypothetical protein